MSACFFFYIFASNLGFFIVSIMFNVSESLWGSLSVRSHLYPRLRNFAGFENILFFWHVFIIPNVYRMMLISFAGSPRWEEFKYIISTPENCLQLFLVPVFLTCLFCLTDKRRSEGCLRIHPILLQYFWLHLWFEAINGMLSHSWSWLCELLHLSILATKSNFIW